MKNLPPPLLWLYRGALVIYPRRLRFAYREQMLQTLRDAYRDRNVGTVHFWFRVYKDLAQSSFMERSNMMRDFVFKAPIAFHTAALALVLTLLGGAAAITMQQMLRRGANQPQIDMAQWYAGEIGAGEAPGNVIPPGYVDLERSLQPFVIFYDEQGNPGPGTGYLDQKIPTPPAGVFNFVRIHGYENVTWQPRSGVRIASVVRRINSKTPGFILAGRSLRLVEEQERLLWRIVMGGWLAVMALLLAGASLLNRAQRAKPSVA
jgi:hypothetical protein